MRQEGWLFLWICTVVTCGTVLCHGELPAQVFGDPQLSLTVAASGFTFPVHIAHAGDGSGRLFVVEQGGRIKVVRNEVVQNIPFLDISNRVSCCGEQGLLSVAFPPEYALKKHFYVNYTDVNGDTVIARFRASSTNPDIADPDSEEILLGIDQPFANHNGGQIAFGPDGYLYIGMGDGGSGGDPRNLAQNLSDLPGNQRLLGKLLRIDVESGIEPYGIPSGNPVLNDRRSEVWALGLRNPWRFSFDRMNGDLFIGDVGQNTYEEIDHQPAASMGGENYGWRIMEGRHCFESPGCNQAGLVLPIHEYDHSQGDCSVTGGFVYRASSFPRMQGIYFYSDFCTGNIRGLRREEQAWTNTLFLSSQRNITSFGEDEEGDLYVADYSGGNILKLTDALPGMAVPPGQEVILYTPVVRPLLENDPFSAKPLGLGRAASGSRFLTLEVGLGLFDGPVDVYLAVLAHPIDPSGIYLVRQDNSLKSVSEGIFPWKANTLGPVQEGLFGTLDISGLPPGPYTFYLAVTPAGRQDRYYIWATDLVVQ